MKISEIKINPKNPRIIKDDRFRKLVQSIKEFPKMMSLRPIIVDDEGVILGGNMRFKAIKELGLKDIPDDWVRKASDLTDEERKRFVIEDNVAFGEWNWDLLLNDFEKEELNEFGLDIFIGDFEQIKKEIEERELKGFSKTHILFSFPPDVFIKVQSFIKEMLKIENVEYEQSSN
jgi:hypothetical protein